MICVDNLTYFLWFWTAFFWVGFNYWSVFGEKSYSFDPKGMVVLSWLLQVLSWSMIITATSRYKLGESMASNEVFFLTLTNIWRTTQMFYMTAPLTLYSIIMGTSDFLRNRSFGEDISYWVGGDRGAVSKSIVQCWTLLLVCATCCTWIALLAGLVPDEGVSSVLIVTFIGLDVLHPCAYLWLGPQLEKLSLPSEGEEVKEGDVFIQLMYFFRRCIFKVLCPAWWRNHLRTVIFSKVATGTFKWIGPVQHVCLPILTIFFPTLGLNTALMILASVR